MISQAIKRWLRKLFAWWSGTEPEADYAHAVSIVNKSATQESSLRTFVDGSTSQPGITSIAVEHAEDAILSETNRPLPLPEERSEHPVTPPSPPAPPQLAASTEQSNASRTMSTEAGKEPIAVSREDHSPTHPTTTQQLEFLRYLVRRGLVNEGFATGQEPEQYKQS